MLEKQSRAKGFDPRKRKEKDNQRQRKIVANSSDKAARKNAPKIKAMANRAIRRIDRQGLLDVDDVEESADQINIQHRQKPRNWGSQNAAEKRTKQGERRTHYQENGGRAAVQSQAWKDLRERTDDEAMVNLINDQLARLAAKD